MAADCVRAAVGGNGRPRQHCSGDVGSPDGLRIYDVDEYDERTCGTSVRSPEHASGSFLQPGIESWVT